MGREGCIALHLFIVQASGGFRYCVEHVCTVTMEPAMYAEKWCFRSHCYLTVICMLSEKWQAVRDFNISFHTIMLFVCSVIFKQTF
jgi:hypothetical protein